MSAVPKPNAPPKTRPSIEQRRPQPSPEQRFILGNVSWQAYSAIGEALADRPNLRLTYDGENLELMTLSPRHEIYKKWFARLIDTLAEECHLRIATAGSMTFRREDLERGLEPDDCFWIAHEEQMRGRLEWNPERDPPPDLVIEIEISRSALNRMRIYAALNVPEVWRCDGETLTVHLLRPDGTYQPAERSPTFPAIPVGEMSRFLQLSETVDYLSRVRAFRDWVRQQLAGKKTGSRKKKC
jgi:Uma2 family endonuclease